jgi:hypothetical protein
VYRCSVCNAPVLVTQKVIVRRCACKGAIVAEMKARMEGRGGLR